MSEINITVTGLDELRAAVAKAPGEVRKNLVAAHKEVSSEILNTTGLRNYPPVTAANAPGRVDKHGRRMGYYERGAGYWRPARGGGYKLATKSQIYGRKWTSKVAQDASAVTVGNSASYAQYLADDKRQSRVMAGYGWRTLVDVAKSKLAKITAIYQAWVDRAIARVWFKSYNSGK